MQGELGIDGLVFTRYEEVGDAIASEESPNETYEQPALETLANCGAPCPDCSLLPLLASAPCECAHAVTARHAKGHAPDPAQAKETHGSKKFHKFFLMDSSGNRHLAATGEDTGDAHYNYTSSKPFNKQFGCINCHNRKEVLMW